MIEQRQCEKPTSTTQGPDALLGRLEAQAEQIKYFSFHFKELNHISHVRDCFGKCSVGLCGVGHQFT